MIASIAKKIFGSANDRLIKGIHPLVDKINALEPSFESLSDEDLRQRTLKFKGEIQQGKSLDDILPEAFATVREAAKRTLGMRHFDVQLIGGVVLHRGMISEMKTGEGKTLVATLPVYLNALSGKGVHVVTVNDYLAHRDSDWMGKIYQFLGLSVGCITHGLTDSERKAAYACDITYGTNNEFGFDYLRDNMKFSREEMVQRPFNYAIVDEVDSILIDEARTPLIISGPTEDRSELYMLMDKYIPRLAKTDYEKDEKAKTVHFSEDGTKHIEELLKKDKVIPEGSDLYDIENVHIVHHLQQALRAHALFTRDVDYIVKDGKVIIIDEFTGRMMEGRRYSEGLHQALEAKEKVRIQNENQTLASITFQNYFRLYPKLAGMTGTAMTEAPEFSEIYKLEVIEIPTHVAVTRKDEDDAIYRSLKEKNQAIIKLIKECNARKQPVLVGTVSIEKSEHLADLLKKEKIKHNVLNARYHEQEAHIIAQAGQPGAVTIATNMAGRGTDIMLGGNPQMLFEDAQAAEKKITFEEIKAHVARDKQTVLEAGGLCVIGTERHESRRIDNQLRGRSGRQGDPGLSKFFLSLEDDLMRIFGSEKIQGFLQRLGLQEGEAITHPWISRALEKAQQRVEQRNFESRKSVLRFDDVMNDQRKVVYEQRKQLMQADDVAAMVKEMRQDLLNEIVTSAIPPNAYADAWEVDRLSKEIHRIFGITPPIEVWAKEEGIAGEEIFARLSDAVENHIAAKEETYGAETVRDVEKRILLITLDQLWKDHLHALDNLRQGINLRAYAQKDPLNEYKREAFAMFDGMLSSLREMVTQRAAHFEIREGVDLDEVEALAPKRRKMQETRVDPALAAEAAPEKQGTVRNVSAAKRDPRDPSTWGKVSRNELCPCNSGKKYKHCHGQLS